MRIDINPSLYTNEIKDNHNTHSSTQGSQPSTASLAANALAQARAEARNETLENASLFLANQAKKIQLGDAGKDYIVNSLQELLDQMDSMAKQMIDRVVAQLSDLKDGDTILSKLDTSGLSKGEIAIALSSLLSFKGLDPSVKKALKKRLEELMSDVDIELDILAATNGANLTHESMQALKKLYQRAKSGEEGLAHWFNVLSKHKDRKKYLSILIRALSEPLDEGQKRDDLTMVAATVIDLRRILLFLTFEDHCQRIAISCKISENDVKVITLELLDQTWVYPDLVANLIQRLMMDETGKIGFLRRWRELLQLMHSNCFRDAEQKEHINETLLKLNEIWND